jgi:hypothetical protein
MFEWAIEGFYKASEILQSLFDWIMDKVGDIDPTQLALTIGFTLLGYFMMFIVPAIMHLKEYRMFDKIMIGISLPFLAFFIVRWQINK